MIPVLQAGTNCSVLSEGDWCVVVCPQGYTAKGHFRCLETRLVGQSFCYTGPMPEIQTVTKITAGLQLRLSLNSTGPQSDLQDNAALQQVIKKAIAKALSITVDYVTRCSVTYLAASRRLSTGGPTQEYDVLYEVVVPKGRSPAVTQEAAKQLASPGAAEQQIFQSEITSGNLGVKEVEKVVPKLEPTAFQDQVHEPPDGVIVDYVNPSSAPEVGMSETSSVVDAAEDAILDDFMSGMELVDGVNKSTSVPGLGTLTASYVDAQVISDDSDEIVFSKSGPPDNPWEKADKAKVDKVIVPKGVISQLPDGAVLMLTVFDESLPTSDDEVLAAPAVAISLFDVAEEDRVEKLVEPMILQFIVHNTSTCVFWDDVSNQWSTAGVQTLELPDGRLQCNSWHLSIFSAIVDSAIAAITCSNAQILTSEGISKLTEGDWYWGPAAFVLYATLVSQWVILAMAVRFHQQAVLIGNWSAELYSLAFPQDSVSIGAQLLHAFHDIHAISRRFVSRVASMSIAYQTRTLVADVNSALNGAPLNDLEIDNLQSHPFVQTPLYQLVNEQAIISFQHFRDKCDYFDQAWILFVANHPFSKVFFHSCSLSFYFRAHMFTSKMILSQAVSALFFSASGGAPDIESPDECSPGTFLEKALRSIIIGVISNLLVAFPLLLLLTMHKRKFSKKDRKHNIRRIWLCVDLSLASFMHCYDAFAVFFLLCFLANTKWNVQLQFVIAYGTSLTVGYVLKPAALAVLMVAVFHIPSFHGRDVDAVKQDLENHSARSMNVSSKWNDPASERSGSLAVAAGVDVASSATDRPSWSTELSTLCGSADETESDAYLAVVGEVERILSELIGLKQICHETWAGHLDGHDLPATDTPRSVTTTATSRSPKLDPYWAFGLDMISEDFVPHDGFSTDVPTTSIAKQSNSSVKSMRL